MTGKEMISFLKKRGFEVIRIEGSHHRMKNKKTGKQTTVPRHNKELPKGTENAILKQAGLK